MGPTSVWGTSHNFSDFLIRKPVDLTSFGGLQVVYKLANIHLTPEKPSYSGVTWHVEGTMNENIVASVRLP